MRICRKVNLVIALLLVAVCVCAQKVDFSYYTTTDGISNNRVWGLTQDQQGFLWVATDALNRFDGNQFLNYNNQESSVFKKLGKPTAIQTVEEDLLFLRNDNLVQFNTITGIEVTHSLDSFLYPGAIINNGNLLKMPDGRIIIPLFDKRAEKVSLIQFFNGKTTFLVTLDDAITKHDNLFGSLCGDSIGNLYYINKSGEKIIKINLAGERQNVFQFPEKGNRVMVKSGFNKSILAYSNKQLFIIDGNQLRLHPISKYLSEHTFYLHDFICTEEGNLWIAGSDRHLLFYDKVTDEIHEYHEQLKQLIPFRLDMLTLFQDRSGNLWTRTMQGIIKLEQHATLFSTYFSEPMDICGGYCSFRGFAEDDQGIIYTSFYSNIFKFDPDNNTIPQPVLPHLQTPFDLYYHDESLLLNNGCVFDLNTQLKHNPYQGTDQQVDLGIYTHDGQGSLWWAFGRILYYLNHKDEAPRWEKLFEIQRKGDNLIVDIKYDKRGEKVWIASASKLRSYDIKSGAIQVYDNTVLGKDINLRYLYPDKNGILWIATIYGLLRFDHQSGSVKRYTSHDGLANNNVVGILSEGDSCLWLSTNLGLSRFQIVSEKFLNFFENDGLTSNEFNRRSMYKSKKGQFFFGGIRGVNAFYPEVLMGKHHSSTSAEKLVFTTFSKTHHRLDSVITTIFHEPNKSIDIYHYNKSFQIGYTFLDYKNTDKVKYSYKMEGYDKVWSTPSTLSPVSYNTFPSGEYTFKVKVLNSRGQWHPEQLSIPIKIHAPWWESWWAYALYVISLLSLAFAIFNFLKSRWLLQSQLQLEKQEANRLKELDNFKSRFYTNLTHEFRTPLTVILGMAKQILDRPENGVKNAAQLIERNGHNLLQLINQLLDLSKLENQSFTLMLQQKDVVSYLRYVTESYQSYANSQNLSLRFLTSCDELIVDFDPQQIQQIMTNLISNAIKFTPSGGDIQVRLDKGDMDFIIEVADTGVGIPKSELPYIFNRFYQVDDSNTRAREGTGIGLTHTLELVKLMKGHITVDSETERGTIFRISLPITNESDIKPLDVESIAENNLPGNKHHDSMLAFPKKNANTHTPDLLHLLIIEDNVDVVIYIKSCLEGLYHLDIAYNGRVGIEKAIENVPDLIISDVMMPEKDGFEVCDTLKNDERTSHIPIVLLTARVDAVSKITGLRKGADAYMSKPFDKEELLVRLENLAELRQRLQERYMNRITVPSGKQQTSNSLSELDDAFIQKVQTIIEQHYADEDFALPQLCQKLGMSRSQLFRKLKALLNISPSEFIRNYRLQKAKILLESGEMTVSEVAWKVGFKHLSHFSKSFQEFFDFPPSETNK